MSRRLKAIDQPAAHQRGTQAPAPGVIVEDEAAAAQRGAHVRVVSLDISPLLGGVAVVRGSGGFWEVIEGMD
jgi:hypothetical protein